MNYNYGDLLFKGAFMKRKIISTFLLCAMLFGIVFSLASCSEVTTISEAVRNTKGLEQLSADVFIDLDVEAGYNAKSYKITKDVSSVVLEDGERVSSEYSQVYGSDKGDYYTYFDGEYAYLPSGLKMSLEEYSRYNTVYTSLVDDMVVKLPSKLFEEDNNGNKKAKCEENGGKLTVSVEFDHKSSSDMDTFSSIYDVFLANLVKRVKAHLDCEACMKMKAECGKCGAGAVDCSVCQAKRDMCQKCVVENFELEHCSLVMEIDDGYVTSSAVKFNAYLDAGETGENVSICGRIEIHVKNPGQAVTVYLPEGLEKWAVTAYDKRPTLKDFIK